MKSIGGKSSLNPQQQTAILLVAGMLVALLLRAENILSTGHPSSSLSLYSAQQFLRGAASWNNSLSAIFVLDAIALKICNSLWSVFTLEIFAIAAGVFLMFRFFIERNFKRKTAAIVSAWIGFCALALTALGGANEPPVWAFPFTAAFLFFGERAKNKGTAFSIISAVAAGAAACCLPRELMLLPIGLVLFNRYRIAFATSFLLIFALFILLFFHNFGSLSEFTHNYLANHLSDDILLSIFTDKLSALKILLLLSPLAALFFKKSSDKNKSESIFFFWLAIETAFLAISGKTTAAFFLPALIPASVIISGKIQGHLEKSAHDKQTRIIFILFFMSFAGIAVHAVAPHHSHDNHGRDFSDEAVIANVITKNTTPSDRIQVWGRSALIYVLADRSASSTTPVIDPLFSSTTFHGKPVREVFIRDLKRNPPKFLIIEESLLQNGLEEIYAGDKNVSRLNPEVLDFVQKIVGDDYKIIAIEHGIVAMRCVNGESIK